MKIRSVVSALAATACCLGTAFAAAPAPFVVKLIGFNDFRGNLQTPDTFGINTRIAPAQRASAGGVEYMADRRIQSDTTTLVS
jgi:5'-nucleotidase